MRLCADPTQLLFLCERDCVVLLNHPTLRAPNQSSFFVDRHPPIHPSIHPLITFFLSLPVPVLASSFTVVGPLGPDGEGDDAGNHRRVASRGLGRGGGPNVQTAGIPVPLLG